MNWKQFKKEVVMKEKIYLDGVCDYCKKRYATEKDIEDNNLIGSVIIKRNDGNYDTILGEFCSEDCLIKWINSKV